MTGYELTSDWFDWSFENPEKISPNHTALYFFCIHHCNKLGWKKTFGLPTELAKEAIGIKSYNTYIKTLRDLVDFGFVTMVEVSKNQYTSNIIALSNNNKALDKALDKATLTHTSNHSESINSIIKLQTTNNKPIVIGANAPEQKSLLSFELRQTSFYKDLEVFVPTYGKQTVKDFYDYWREPNKSKSKMRFEQARTWDLSLRLQRWIRNEFTNKTVQVNTEKKMCM